MDQRNLRPARDFALQYGVKSIIYGPPGTGKTPILNTAPRPLLLACEPGLLSMRNSTVPTYQATEAKHVDEFFTWLFGSTESRNYDTIGVDSTSEMCEIYLDRANKNNKHGLAAYGDMAKDALKQLNGLYYMQYKHAYLIAKEARVNNNGMETRKPYFPGKELPIKIPHKYDEILHLDIHNIPGVGQYKAFRCFGTIDAMARDRSGRLNEFEPPDFGALVAKCMS